MGSTSLTRVTGDNEGQARWRYLRPSQKLGFRDVDSDSASSLHEGIVPQRQGVQLSLTFPLAGISVDTLSLTVLELISVIMSRAVLLANYICHLAKSVNVPSLV